MLRSTARKRCRVVRSSSAMASTVTLTLRELNDLLAVIEEYKEQNISYEFEIDEVKTQLYRLQETEDAQEKATKDREAQEQQRELDHRLQMIRELEDSLVHMDDLLSSTQRVLEGKEKECHSLASALEEVRVYSDIQSGVSTERDRAQRSLLDESCRVKEERDELHLLLDEYEAVINKQQTEIVDLGLKLRSLEKEKRDAWALPAVLTLASLSEKSANSSSKKTVSRAEIRDFNSGKSSSSSSSMSPRSPLTQHSAKVEEILSKVKQHQSGGSIVNEEYSISKKGPVGSWVEGSLQLDRLLERRRAAKQSTIRASSSSGGTDGAAAEPPLRFTRPPLPMPRAQAPAVQQSIKQIPVYKSIFRVGAGGTSGENSRANSDDEDAYHTDISSDHTYHTAGSVDHSTVHSSSDAKGPSPSRAAGHEDKKFQRPRRHQHPAQPIVVHENLDLDLDLDF